MTNEIKNEVSTQTGNDTASEVLSPGMQIINETENYTVYKDEKGKFVRKAKFSNYSSVFADTRESKIWLMNLIENDEETGQGLKDNVGKEIIVSDIITRTYDKINEDTGQLEYGVLTYLITPERNAFVTSSKSVYFSVIHIMELLGKPGSEYWEDIKIKVGKEKGHNGDMIKIKLIG